jgi:uncharacterized C2H2 Zn-finger protein
MRQKATVYLEAREYVRLCKGHEVELALSDGHSVALALDASVLASLSNGRASGRVRGTVRCPQCDAVVKRAGLKQHLYKVHTVKGRDVARRASRVMLRARRAKEGGAA